MEDKQSVEHPTVEMTRLPLPVELFNRILAHELYEKEGLYNCMLVSQQMHQIAAPYYYHTLAEWSTPRLESVLRRATSGNVGSLQKRYLGLVQKLDVRECPVDQYLESPKLSLDSIFPSLRIIRVNGGGGIAHEHLERPYHTTCSISPSTCVVRFERWGQSDAQICDARSDSNHRTPSRHSWTPLARPPTWTPHLLPYLLTRTTSHHTLSVCDYCPTLPDEFGCDFDEYPPPQGAETWVITPSACSQLWSRWRSSKTLGPSEDERRLALISALARHFWKYRKSPQLIVGMETFYRPTNSHDAVDAQTAADNRLVEIRKSFCEHMDNDWKCLSRMKEVWMSYEDMVKYRAQVSFMSLRQWIDTERVEEEISLEEAESWFELW